MYANKQDANILVFIVIIGVYFFSLQQMWVMDEENDKMELREISFVPGLYKIFDEIIGKVLHG